MLTAQYWNTVTCKNVKTVLCLIKVNLYHHNFNCESILPADEWISLSKSDVHILTFVNLFILWYRSQSTYRGRGEIGGVYLPSPEGRRACNPSPSSAGWFYPHDGMYAKTSPLPLLCVLCGTDGCDMVRRVNLLLCIAVFCIVYHCVLYWMRKKFTYTVSDMHAWHELLAGSVTLDQFTFLKKKSL